MRYHNITKDDMLNGDGIRVVLWLSGCNHRCKGCHNPITWNPYYGVDFNEAAVSEIYAELKKDYVSGLTLSGGDPLHTQNVYGVTVLCKQVKSLFPNKTIWLYTGYNFDQVKHLEVIKYLDVIVDGQYEKDLPSAQWVGSKNQKVIRLC